MSSLPLTQYALSSPRRTLAIVAGLTVLVLLLTISPNLISGMQSWIKPLTIDTDPENMLPFDDQARVFHRQMKQVFNLSDTMLVGIVNESHKDGVFNSQTLANAHKITETALTLEGVVAEDVLSPFTVDSIQHDEEGTVFFEWLMEQPPATSQVAPEIKQQALRIPLLHNTLVASDGKALMIYLPLESKEQSYAIYKQLQAVIATLENNTGDRYHITGLPVAEDVFGVEMFIQMAVVAPIAMLLIFALLFFFFRNVTVVASALLVAFVSVVWTMGALVIAGNTIHIMSSMIPIFIMPIAVLDAVHIHSEFFDRHNATKNRKDTLQVIMQNLHTPMLFTTLTTAVGFASLWFTPIPPIKIFGLFVAVGVVIAWLLTITVIPAYLLLMKESSLSNFGAQGGKSFEINNWLNKHIQQIGRHSYRHAGSVIIVIVGISIAASVGLNSIQVNDNPINWFDQKHDIRVADAALNQHSGGTYMPYLTFHSEQDDTFKSPELLRYIEDLQNHLTSQAVVGKVNSIVDIVKTVHRELFFEDTDSFSIPDNPEAVAQLLLIYQNSFRADDLWKFVNYDYNRINLWVQMTSGNNQDMNAIVETVDQYIQQNPPPQSIEHAWFGLSYINSVWQDKMVTGMLKAFLGSFICVFIIMLILFRSLLWSALAMVPLSLSVLIIYGAIGWIGKDYDMPIAVLSSLSLGLAIDYAIHFISRSRQYLAENNNCWQTAWPIMFGEPARAIFKNIFIVGLGFLPLLFSPLVPYNTVGVLIASILFLAGFVTLWVLPALITIVTRPAEQ